MRERHWTIRVGLLITVGTLVMIAFASYSAHRTRVAAERFVREVAALQLGISSAQEVERIVDKYISYTSTPEGLATPCEGRDCPVILWFHNAWLERLHLARPKILRVALTVSDGHLTSIAVATRCYVSNGGQVNASVIEDLYSQSSFPGGEAFRPFSIGGTYSGGRQTVLIDMTPAASPEQRRWAYRFNFQFLDRLGACNEAHDMHPSKYEP